MEEKAISTENYQPPLKSSEALHFTLDKIRIPYFGPQSLVDLSPPSFLH